MNFVLIAFCLMSGFVLRSSGIIPENSHKGINAWLLYIALPAMTLLYVPTITWDRALILPATMPMLVWVGAWILVKALSRRLALDKGTQAALLLTAGLGNTSFAGFPLTQAYFGDEGLRIAVICDQISFLALSTVGVLTAQNGTQGADFGMKSMARNILRFPSFLAFIAALFLPGVLPFEALHPLLTKLSATLVPLALFSVGLQLHFSEWKRELPPLSIGLAYKLLIAPGLVLCAALAFQIRGIIGQTSVFEAAMAPMVTSAILAAEYRLRPQLANLMVSVGILCSMGTTALWWLILKAAL